MRPWSNDHCACYNDPHQYHSMKRDKVVDRQILIDRLLETENLTDNLEDEDAKVLIKWGVEQVDTLIDGIDNEEEAGVRINHLMQLMREINTIAGNPSTASEDKLSKLNDSYSQTFEITHPIDTDTFTDMTEKLTEMQPGEAVKFLMEWMQSNKKSSSNE